MLVAKPPVDQTHSLIRVLDLRWLEGLFPFVCSIHAVLRWYSEYHHPGGWQYSSDWVRIRIPAICGGTTAVVMLIALTLTLS